MMRQGDHNEDVANSVHVNFVLMLVEMICFVGIIAFQLHHIKKSLDHKLLI